MMRPVMKVRVRWSIALGLLGAVLGTKRAEIEATPVAIGGIAGAAVGYAIGCLLSLGSRRSGDYS